MPLNKQIISILGLPNRFAGLLLLALGLLALVQARPAHAQAATFPIIQDFRSTTAPGWLLSGTTALTANADGAGNGWLRLTSASGNRAGTAIYDTAFPSTDGIVVRFSYATHGGSGADGFSFFLLDGSAAIPSPAPPVVRSATPRSKRLLVSPMPMSELASTNLAISPTIQPWEPRRARTHKGQTRSCCGVLGTALRAIATWPARSWPELPLAVNHERPVEIVILGGKITVKVDYGSGYVTEINEYDLSTATGQTALPATFKLGFSGSTGGSTNFHEIRDTSIRKPGDLSIAMSADKTVAASGEPRA